MIIGTVLFMCAGSLSLGIGKIMGIDMTDKIILPKISSNIKSNSFKSLDSGNEKKSNSIIPKNNSSSTVSDSTSSNNNTDETNNPSDTSYSSNSGSSNSANNNTNFDWNSFAETASNKEFNNKVNEQMASGSYSNAVSLITRSADSSTRIGIKQTGLGNLEGTKYDLGTGIDYFISDSGDIYTKMNDNYGYDENGNLVKLSAQEKLDKISLSNPEHENYYWSLLRTED